jgi:hypothetical protein
VVVGTPVRSESSPMDNNVGVTDVASVRLVPGIDFKSTRSALLT